MQLVVVVEAQRLIDPDTRVEFEAALFQTVLASGMAGGGMLPKLQNCIEAIEKGVARVHVLDGRVPHCLLLEFFTEKGVGTAILKEPLF